MPFSKIFFFSLFFISLFLVSSVSAYTQFALNPEFNAGYDGLIAVNNYSTSFSWNETCYGMDGCFRAETNATPSFLSLYLSNWDAFYQPPLVLDLYSSYSYITLPAHKTGIVYLQYYSNATLGGYIGITSTPMLYIIVGGSPIISTQLSATAEQWNNFSAIIDATTSDRQVQVLFGYSTTEETDVMINKFDFFTYDDDAISLTSASQATLSAMCNQTTSDLVSSIAEGCQYSFGTLADAVSTINGSSVQYLFFHGRDNVTCLAYQYGNIISSRYAYGYCVGSIGGGTNSATYAMHSKDMTILKGKDTAIGGDYTLYVNSFPNPTNLQCTMKPYDSGSDYVKNAFNNSIYGGFPLTSTITYNLTYCAKAFKTNLSNVNFTGSYWYIGGSSGDSALNTSVHWNYFQQTCNSGQSCNSNTEQWVSNDCSISTIRSCGDCGCNADLINCNDAGFVGTRCRTDDPNHHLYELSDNCTSYMKTCDLVGKEYDGWCEDSAWHPDFPVWTLSTGEIVCYDFLANTTPYYINATGENLTYVNPLSSTDYLFSNPLQGLALAIGGIFSIKNDLEASENVTSFLIAIISGVAVIILIALYSKRNVDSKGLGSAGLGFSTLVLLMFSFVPDSTTGTTWFPSWIAIVITALVALLLSGALSKIVGGDK